jgi:tripartite-type tricarboxylate transporter receptor subunit TctC
MNRRRLLGLTLAAASMPAARAQPFPTRPVRWVVPFPAWGITDRLARAVAPALEASLGQPMWIDNRSGGAGSTGSLAVARADADGYTLLVATSNTHAIAPHLHARLPYRTSGADSDFTPVALLAEVTHLLLVSPALAVKNVRELIGEARVRPGRLSYASAGAGTASQLAAEAFKARAGVYVTHIPYRNTSSALPDLAANRVQILFDSLPSGLPAVRDGQARALAVTGRRRSPLVPKLPTVDESGLPGFHAVTWFGVFGPKGLPVDVVERLNRAVAAAVATAEVRERFAALGADPVPALTPVQFGAWVEADSRRWGDLIRDRKIDID